MTVCSGLLSGSHDTIDSGEHYGRYLHVPNGRSGYTPVPLITVNKSRSVSLDMSNAEEAVRMAVSAHSFSLSLPVLPSVLASMCMGLAAEWVCC